MKSFGFCVSLLAAVALLSVTATINAQDKYPSTPVRVVVGFPAGTNGDILGRLYVESFNNILGRSFVLENVPGAASNIAAAQVARAEPDGRTLFMASSANSVAVSVSSKLNYKFPDDFEAIKLLWKTPQILVVNAQSNIHSLAELIAQAKAKPGEILYGSGGVGSAPHLATELLSIMSGVQMTHVPYKGTTEAAADLLAGRITMLFSTLPIIGGFVESGKFRTLAITSAQRSTLLPDVPTVAELGFPGFDVVLWFGLMAPKSTPQPIIETLAQAVEKTHEDPNIQKKIAQSGSDLVSMSTADFRSFIRTDIPTWKKAVDHANIRNE